MNGNGLSSCPTRMITLNPYNAGIDLNPLTAGAAYIRIFIFY